MRARRRLFGARANFGATHYLLRGLAALATLCIAACAGVFVLVAVGLVAPAALATDWPALASLLLIPESTTGLDRLGVVALSLFVMLAALIFFVRLLGHRSLPAALHMLDASDQGFVVIESRGIESIAAQASASVHGVVDASARVWGTGTSPVRVRVDVGVHPGVNVRDAGTAVREAARDAVESLVGIGVLDVTVALRVLEPDELRKVWG